jgi:FMN phosphatase YigB (HAD superfamily)
MKECDLITFDCYETLIDWETGITEAFRDEASRDGIELLRDAISTAYHATEKTLEGGDSIPYSQILAKAA